MVNLSKPRKTFDESGNVVAPGQTEPIEGYQPLSDDVPGMPNPPGQKRDDGGPAFAMGYYDTDQYDANHQQGMSLRDHLAGQALASSNQSDWWHNPRVQLSIVMQWRTRC